MFNFQLCSESCREQRKESVEGGEKKKRARERLMMRNKGRGSQNSLVTKAQRNRGAGPTPLLLSVCVSPRTGLPEGGGGGGVVDCVCV